MISARPRRSTPMPARSGRRPMSSMVRPPSGNRACPSAAARRTRSPTSATLAGRTPRTGTAASWGAAASSRACLLCRSLFPGLAGTLGTQGADDRPGTPHLAFGDLFQLLLQLGAVVRTAVALQRPPRLLAGLDLPVQLLEQRLDHVTEALEPVESAALGGRRAVGVHPVHAVLGDQWIEALRRLLDRLVERLARRMTVLAQHLVLSQPQPVDGAHQHAAFARQVADHLVVKGRLEQVARADGDAARQAALARPSRCVLVYRKAGVDALALQEV